VGWPRFSINKNSGGPATLILLRIWPQPGLSGCYRASWRRIQSRFGLVSWCSRHSPVIAGRTIGRVGKITQQHNSTPFYLDGSGRAAIDFQPEEGNA
jgi:hypothetical protein